MAYVVRIICFFEHSHVLNFLFIYLYLFSHLFIFLYFQKITCVWLPYILLLLLLNLYELILLFICV